MSGRPGAGWRRLRRASVLAAALSVTVILLWWAAGRVTAEGRRLTVRDLGEATLDTFPVPESVTEPERADTLLRVLAWNVAHGRGDDTTGWLANWRGGGRPEREERLRRIGSFLRRIDADVVVLNEVDFDAVWSGGVDQAAFLARAAGYPVLVEQRNFDLRLPFATLAFGNAVLSRLPVPDARWLRLPVRSRLESALAGAKAAATVRVRTTIGPVTVVPIHLEFRSGPTRREAVPVLDSLRAAEVPPVVLAGDFNAAPPGWPGASGPTVLGRLLKMGWRSPRAEGPPRHAERTWPAPAPRQALDWILVEPPLAVVEARVLSPGGGLSDHAPVLAVIRLSHGRPPGPPPPLPPPP